MMFLSGMIGMLVAFALNQDAAFSLVVGYVGGDVIENVYKTIKGKKSIYSKKE